MAILVKLSASLRQKVAGYDPAAGLSLEPAGDLNVAGLLARMGLAPGDVKIIMLNGRAAALDSSVGDGDRVGLFPAVGGG